MKKVDSIRIHFFAYTVSMKNNKICELYCANYQLLLPIEMDFIIPKDDSVRLLNTVLEGLDYSKLYSTYSTYGRNPVISPKTLFKVLVYGYFNGIYSSRGIEKACRRDINFMWLLNGAKAPDYSTISRFRKDRLNDCIENLFYQFVLFLGELEEIKFENLFVDGTKIEANANKYTFVWKKAIDKNQAKMHEKIHKLIKNINKAYNANFLVEDCTTIGSLERILEKLYIFKETNNIEFVYGKGKRKKDIQRYIEELEEYIKRQRYYNDCYEIFNGRNSFSKTDNDATFMHMKEDHMRNSQLKPGYNIQIGVEAEYIVGAYISSDRSDTQTLIPFLNVLSLNLKRKYLNLIADAGYESEENYMYLEEKEMKPFIKPLTYDTIKKKNFKNKISRHENMNYDPTLDTYTCHNNKRLVPIGTKIRKSKSGYQSIVTIYECQDCNECTHKSKCTKAKGNKRLEISKRFIEKRAESLTNITSDEGIILRINRSIQDEGTFGVIKEDHNFRRFLMRGYKNVTIEFLLKALAFDIEKLHNKIQQERAGEQLHCEKTA